MHSHRYFEDFAVSGVPECSGTLLFVQVGRGVATVDIGGAVRILRDQCSLLGPGISSAGVTDVLWLTRRSD